MRSGELEGTNCLVFFLVDALNEKTGPFEIAALLEMIESGEIDSSVIVENSGTGQKMPLSLLPEFIAAQPSFKPPTSPGPYKSPLPYTRTAPGRMTKEAIEKGLKQTKPGSGKATWLVWAGFACAISALICAWLLPYFYIAFSAAAVAFAQDSKTKGYRRADLLLILAAATIPLGLALAALSVSL